VVEGDEDEVDGVGQRAELRLEPLPLGTSVGDIGGAVELEEVDAGAEGDRVPAAAAQLRKGCIPVVEAELGAARELVIAEGGVDAEVGGSPRRGLLAVDVVVGGVAALVGNVAGELEGGGLLRGDAIDEQLAS